MRRAIHVERRLDVAPAALFDVIADHARYDRFDGIRRAELKRTGDPAPNGVGALRWIWIGPLRFAEEITVFEPGRRLDYMIREVKPLPFRHEGGTITFAEEGGGTHVVWKSVFEIPIPIVGVPLDRLFAARLERGFGDTLEASAELAVR